MIQSVVENPNEKDFPIGQLSRKRVDCRLASAY
jgi:hypothetical protein